jgi:zinc transport system substrate-binding protein
MERNKTLRILAVAALAALSAGWLAGCPQSSKPASRPAGKLRITATLFPLADVARQIAGPDAEVTCLVRPGVSPHDYRPTAADTELLANTDLVIMVGLGIDDWVERQVKAASQRPVKIVRLGDMLPKTPNQSGATRPASAAHANHDDPDEEGEHHHEVNPHVWLDPSFMMNTCCEIYAAMRDLDQSHADAYQDRVIEYRGKLGDLGEEYAEKLAPFKGRGFVTFHEAFSYIADRYGLKEMALQRPNAGGYGPRRLEELVKFMKDNNVRAIFVEPQFPAERLQELARQTGARLGRLDPEGNPDVKGYDSYLHMMQTNMDALVDGLKD